MVFFANSYTTSLLSSGMQRQLIVTRQNKPSGKTFRLVHFAARFTSTSFPTNCSKFPRIFRSLTLFKAKVNYNKSTNKFQNFTVFALLKTILTVNI